MVKSLSADIEKMEDYDLSNGDIEKITNGKCKIMAYHELANVNSLSEILNNNGACILLYETKEGFGHWVAIFEVPNTNKLEFFDSYGFSLDEELQYSAYNNTPYLSNLVKADGRVVMMNKAKLQKFAKDVNTCGRWTAVRIALKQIPLPIFTSLFKNNQFQHPDFWVSALTYIFTIH